MQELDYKESWVSKNWCFWIVVLEKTLKSLGQQGDQTKSILTEINSEYSLEGMMLKLKLQYFGHLMQRFDSLEKTLMLGVIGGRRRRGQQRMRWLDSITDSMDMNLSKLREIVKVRGAWTWPSIWTTTATEDEVYSPITFRKDKTHTQVTVTHSSASLMVLTAVRTPVM